MMMENSSFDYMRQIELYGITIRNSKRLSKKKNDKLIDKLYVWYQKKLNDV